MLSRFLIAVIILFLNGVSIAQTNAVLKGLSHVNQAEQYKLYLNYGEAILYYETALETFINTFDESHPLVTLNYAAIGKCYLETGDIEKAKLYCKNGLKNIEKKLPNGAIAATCLECLATIAQTEKNYSKAFTYFEKAQRIHQQLWGENHVASSELYLLLGDFYLEQQQFEKANIYFEKVKILNKTKSEFDFESNAERYLAQYYEATGQWYFQQQRWTEAATNFNESLKIYQQINGQFHPSIAKIHLQLGDVFYQKNEFKKAIAAYDLVYSTFQDYSKKEFAIEGYDTCRCNVILIASTLGKARSHEQQFAQNQRINDLNIALEHYKKVAQKVNSAVKYFAKDARHRQQIIHQHKPIFTNAVRISYQLFELTNDENYTKQAFDFINRYKALTLQIEQKQQRILRADIPKKIQQEQTAWETKIADLQLAVYKAEMENAADLVVQKEALLEAMIEQAAFQRDFKNNYWYVEDSVFGKDLVAFSTISNQLNDETVLLNYVLDKSKNQLFIIAFTDEKTHFIHVDLPKTFLKDVQQFHRLLQSSLLSRADKKQRFVQKGNQLYQNLIEPITAILNNKKRLIIIRDDVLHLLPFEALLKNNDLKDFQHLDYLLHDFEIIYHYSTGLWYHSQTQQWQGKPNSLLAFAPVFDNGNPINAADDDNALRCFIQDEVQVPLPHSEEEVTTIQQTLNAPKNSILLRKNATKEQLIANLEKPHRFVHIASHSFANYDNAAFSGIACFVENEKSSSNYMLYISEIENLNIQSDLVVLSSCESGIGQLLNGEGLLGLNRSFLYAGVPNTLFSLWKVQDEATALLMIEFYKNIQQQQDYTSALQQAKLTLLQNPKTAAPNFWASFILMGR